MSVRRANRSDLTALVEVDPELPLAMPGGTPNELARSTGTPASSPPTGDLPAGLS